MHIEMEATFFHNVQLNVHMIRKRCSILTTQTNVIVTFTSVCKRKSATSKYTLTLILWFGCFSVFPKEKGLITEPLIYSSYSTYTKGAICTTKQKDEHFCHPWITFCWWEHFIIHKVALSVTPKQHINVGQRRFWLGSIISQSTGISLNNIGAR